MMLSEYNNIHILLISAINHFQTTPPAVRKNLLISFLMLIGFMNTYISITTVRSPRILGEIIIIFSKTVSRLPVSATDASQSRTMQIKLLSQRHNSSFEICKDCTFK